METREIRVGDLVHDTDASSVNWCIVTRITRNRLGHIEVWGRWQDSMDKALSPPSADKIRFGIYDEHYKIIPHSLKGNLAQFYRIKAQILENIENA